MKTVPINTILVKDNQMLDRLISYIEEHIEDDLTLDRIAEALNYSKFYMSRTFAERTGCTIYKYIQGRRLTLAAKKLVETKEPIIDIAYEAHYNSQQAFTLAFSRLYQCSPQAYRRQGIFYPMQTRMDMYRTNYRQEGRMAA